MRFVQQPAITRLHWRQIDAGVFSVLNEDIKLRPPDANTGDYHNI